MDPTLLWRLLSGGLGLFNVGSQARAQGDYEADQDQQIAQALGVASQVGPETLGTYDASAQQQLGTLEDMRRRAGRGTQDLYRSTGQSRGEFLRDLDTRGRGLLQGYQDRYNRAASDIEGYGQQQEADIDKRFDNQQARFRLNPLSRGSTIGSTVSRNIDTERSAEQRRLGEDLTRQRVNLLSGLSGEQLGAQGALDASRAAFDSALRGQLLDTQRYGFETGQNAQGNIGNFYGANAINRSGLTNQGLNTYLNTLSGINMVPPPPPNLQGMGAGLIQPVQPQVSGWEAFLGGAAPGLGMGAGFALASDRNLKENITVLTDQDSEAMLRRLEDMPVARWKYKGGWDHEQHIGPMAQDFGASFTDDPEATKIFLLDAVGVLMASVKALSAQVRDLKAKVVN